MECGAHNTIFLGYLKGINWQMTAIGEWCIELRLTPAVSRRRNQPDLWLLGLSCYLSHATTATLKLVTEKIIFSYAACIVSNR